jgi:zinc transporter ZupT
LVNLATLVGVLVLVPTMMGGCSYARSLDDKASKRVRYFVYTLIPSFAAGALLATSAFLLIPESVLLIGNATGAAEHDHRRHLKEDNAEGQLAWKFGASFLGGFLIPIFMGSIFPHAHEDEVPQDDCPVCEERDSRVLLNLKNTDKAVPVITCHASLSPCDEGACNKDSHGHEVEEEVWDGESCSTSNDNNASAVTAVPEHAVPVKDATNAKVIEPKEKIINYRLATSLFLGDFFHNFADGIFLGTAFKLCERSVAIAVAVATIYHELAQELADYFLLTEHCGIPPVKALILNFLNGLSVVIGVIIILALDVSNMATGCILAVSAGVYVHVAASECIPRIEKELKTFKDRAISILCFFLGAVPIGLVLLNHGHCTG